MAENAPEYAQFPNDFMASPRRVWYQRGYNPGKGVPCSVVCFRGETGEFLLDSIARLADGAGLRNVYLDGPSVPFSCRNLNHRCGEELPARWDEDYDHGRIAGQRAFLKRLRGIFDSRGVRTPIWHHTGGGFDLPCFALCDYYWDGEQLSRYRHGYLLPPTHFTVLYSGRPFGFQGLFLNTFYSDAMPENRQSLAWTAPNGVVPSYGTFPEYLRLVQRDSTFVFYPFTEKQPHIVRKLKNTLNVSYYLGKEEAILVSGNAVYHGTQQESVDLSGLFPGRSLAVRCLNREETPCFQNGILTLFCCRTRCKNLSCRACGNRCLEAPSA